MSARINNKLKGRESAKVTSPLLKPFTVLALVLIGLFSFAALTVLLGYADELREKETGQATPISRSAVGYVGLTQLLDDVGFNVETDPNPYKSTWQSREKLRIYTPSNSFQGGDIEKLAKDMPKLIILPKWSVVQLKDKAGWVRKGGYSPFSKRVDRYVGKIGSGIYLDRIPTDEIPTDLILGDAALDFEDFQYFTSTRPKSTVTNLPTKDDVNEDTEGGPPELRGKTDEVSDELSDPGENDVEEAMEEILESLGVDLDEDTNQPVEFETVDMMFGKSILIKLEGSRTYILSDPDYVNNHGLKKEIKARVAVDMISQIIREEELDPYEVTFDLALHNLGGKPNIIKLMTQPPFLAATLCLLAAGALVIWQGFTRFGDPMRLVPDYSLGPASLAKTSAAFLATAGRVNSMGAAYADLTQRQVIRRLGLSGQSREIIEKRLKARETLRDIKPTFEELQHIRQEQSPMGFTTRARALAKWKEEMIRDR